MSGGIAEDKAEAAERDLAETRRMLAEIDAAVALADSKGLDDGDTVELRAWDEAVKRHAARQRES